jgi:hypothetical protein
MTTFAITEVSHAALPERILFRISISLACTPLVYLKKNKYESNPKSREKR